MNNVIDVYGLLVIELLIGIVISFFYIIKLHRKFNDIETRINDILTDERNYRREQYNEHSNDKEVIFRNMDRLHDSISKEIKDIAIKQQEDCQLLSAKSNDIREDIYRSMQEMSNSLSKTIDGVNQRITNIRHEYLSKKENQ